MAATLLDSVRRRRRRPRHHAGSGRSTEAVVLGAGPSGLAIAAMLERCGVNTVVLERTEVLAAPWHQHYEGIRLQSPATMSYLPGLQFARTDGRWVDARRLLDYLARYRDHHGIDVRHGVHVQRLDRTAGGWLVRTSAGTWTAPVVVVATGHNRDPHIPAWPGLNTFSGELLHASEFRTAEPFSGKDVLVVGTGNSGAEIASIVARGRTSRTRLAVRSPPHVVRKTILGVPTLLGPAAVEPLPPRVGDALLGPVNRLMVGDLAKHGLGRPRTGIHSQYVASKVTPIIDTGFLSALKARLIEPVSEVTGFHGPQVLLGDNSRISPEVVIAATGYRKSLEGLLGHLGALSEGDPVADGPRGVPGQPGLYFIGYTHPFSGNLRRLRIDAPKLARKIATFLETRQHHAPRTAESTPTTRTGDSGTALPVASNPGEGVHVSR